MAEAGIMRLFGGSRAVTNISVDKPQGMDAAEPCEEFPHYDPHNGSLALLAATHIGNLLAEHDCLQAIWKVS